MGRSALTSYLAFLEGTVKGMIEEAVVFGLSCGCFESEEREEMYIVVEIIIFFTLVTPPPNHRYISSSITLEFHLSSSSLVESFLRSNSDLPLTYLHCQYTSFTSQQHNLESRKIRH